MAAVRAEVARWTVGDPKDDPGETLLRLITQSRIRAETLASEIDQKVTEAQERFGNEFTLEAVLIGSTIADGHKTGEYIRGLVALESEERDRLGGFVAKALAAGIAERQSRISERTGELLAAFLIEIREDPEFALTPAQKAAMPNLVRRHLDRAATQGGAA